MRRGRWRPFPHSLPYVPLSRSDQRTRREAPPPTDRGARRSGRAQGAARAAGPTRSFSERGDPVGRAAKRRRQQTTTREPRRKRPRALSKEGPRGRGPRAEAGRGGGPTRPRQHQIMGRGRGPADRGGDAAKRQGATLSHEGERGAGAEALNYADPQTESIGADPEEAEGKQRRRRLAARRGGSDERNTEEQRAGVPAERPNAPTRASETAARLLSVAFELTPSERRRAANPQGGADEARSRGGGGRRPFLSRSLCASLSDFQRHGRPFPLCPRTESILEAIFRGFFSPALLTVYNIVL